MADNLVLVSEANPDVYGYDQIYNPDTDGTDVSASGKYVPAINSLVIKHVTGTITYYLYVVTEVDATTYKSTLVPIRIVNATDTLDELIGYGNDDYMLFFDDTVSQTRLVIDSKLALYGSNSAEYKLIREVDGTRVSIALDINTEGNVVSDRIPIVATSYPDIRKCNNCYTATNMVENEIIYMEIYDSSGIQTGQISLVTKRSLVLNDFESSSNPITGFNVEANQESGSDLVLYVGQDKSDLTLYPELVFSDGAKQKVSIDNASCFMYGMDAVTTDYPGMEYELLIKYFLSDRMTSTIAEGEDVRYLALRKTLTILAKDAHLISKISVVPLWNSATSSWRLVFFAYYVDRNNYNIIASTNIVYTVGSFDGSLTTAQEFTISVETTDGNGNASTHIQEIAVKCLTTSDTEPFVIAVHDGDTLTYGRQTALLNRPLINYSEDQQKYFIPTSLFTDKNEFLDNFYIQANPPYNTTTESVAPTPTHFTLRDANTGRVLLASAQSVDNYNALMSLLTEGTKSQYNNQTIILEFLKESGTQYQILYGVPVEVKTGIWND